MGESAQKVQECCRSLRELLLQQLTVPEVRTTAIEGLTLARREAENSAECCFARPLMSVIVQGSKQLTVGTQRYPIHAGQCLVSGVDLPTSSYVVNATAQQPFLSLFVYLDKEILQELITTMGADVLPPPPTGCSLSVADADADVLTVLLRLVELLHKPQQIPIRAPLLLRELHYVLLMGEQGGVLRALYAPSSQNNQILQAITLIKQNMAVPLSVESIARQVGMSLSSLHRHFKHITGFSPLQYHKQLRLHTAQHLMLVHNERASSAALSVGYENVTQFTREYKRMFGEPPRRDIARRRTVWATGNKTA